jgi:RNase P subunit RPR2
MKNGICRNCRQQTVFKKKADPDYSIPIRTLSVAAVYHFVCANCGYIENYILEENKLRQIENNWEYIIPAQDKPKPSDDD